MTCGSSRRPWNATWSWSRPTRWREFARPFASCTRISGLRIGRNRATSLGKTADLRSIHRSHLRPPGPDRFGLRVSWPSRPPGGRLLCASCCSGRSFACRFLPTPPRDDAVAVQLGIPAIKAPRGLTPPSHAPCPAHEAAGRAAGGDTPCDRHLLRQSYLPTFFWTHSVETDFGRVMAVPIARLRINCASIPIERETENSTV